MSGRGSLAAIASVTLFSLGCPGPRTPRVSAAEPLTLAVGREGGSPRGVAADDARTYLAVTTLLPAKPDLGIIAPIPSTRIEARRGTELLWDRTLTGDGGPLVATGTLVVAALTGTGRVGDDEHPPQPAPVHGEPGAAIVALDAAHGRRVWRLALDASEWVVVSAMATAPDGVLVAGSYSGSLRVADRVVSSGGRSDGFVAKLTPSGGVAWLVRVGGPGPDAVQGVAARGAQIAIAGTFVAGADLLGQALPAFDEKSPFPDVFVASLDANGGRVWATTFGGKLADSVAGVAISASGSVAVAANARDVMHVGGADLVAQGPADGLVASWAKDGTATHAILLGGPEFDGLRAITAVGDRIVVAGFYSGSMQLGDRASTAGGGDDAFVAALDRSGAVVESWQISGAGREEVSALAAIAGGFVAGVAHTAALAVGEASLPAPADPLAGAAIVVRAVR
jgi:outer membrane protein assembly factor BamB